MCGIVGFTGSFEEKHLKSMNRALTHRGPDEEGYYHRPGIGLAMRRLSIIDVESGHQPIANEDRTVWTVFNGEIYNFQELRRDLKKAGHRFCTDHSDTEVIVHAYEEYGENFVERLNGMFAIAVWDERKQKLLLYRDRLGEKPLYFWRKGSNLFFASEIKSILQLPFFSKQLNEEALYYYLSLKHTPRHLSFFKGIESVSPGEYVSFQKGLFKRLFYWEIDASRTLKISEQDAVAEIRKLLKSSVRYRMISDVPLGAYLSGGVDSSAVVGLMSRIRKSPIETFSLTYQDTLDHKERDRESAFEMAQRFHTNHREYRMGHEEFEEDLEKIIHAFDEPFGGTISTFYLSKLIRKHVKVAVSGDGADELFGSYKVHRLAYPMDWLRRYRQAGKNMQKLTSSELKKLVPFQDQLAFLLSIEEREPWQWHSKLAVFNENEKRSLFSAKQKKKFAAFSIRDYFKKIYQRTTGDDPLNRVLQVECQNLLPDHVLAFVDRLSMAHSVEVRPPFLDHRLVEFAFRLPGSMKIRGTENKYILKKAVRGILPAHIIRRPKEGFILPYHYWMKTYMGAKIKSILSERNLKQHGLFDPVYVSNLVSQFNQGGLGEANKVYLLMMFQLWWQRTFGKVTS